MAAMLYICSALFLLRIESAKHRSAIAGLDKICDIHRHLLDLRVIIAFDVFHCSYIIVSHEIYGDSLSAKAAAPSDPVQVILHVLWEIEVDHKRNLLHIDATGE